MKREKIERYYIRILIAKEKMNIFKSYIDLFDNAIVDPYLDSETANLVSENSEWKLDNMIWPIHWCDIGENNP